MSFFFSRRHLPADTAAFIGAPLAGETVRTWIFLFTVFALRHVHHAAIVGQFYEAHFSFIALFVI